MATATAADRWAEQLAAWAIPDEILAAAPESPWTFSRAIFTAPADPGPDTTSRRRAREALPEGGVVLDVGCGGGAAGLALVPPAGRVVGFDQSADLLDAFSTRANELGVDFAALQGSWPDDHAKAPVADVVVCHHVAYNVPGLATFAEALSAHAGHRVVMELSGRHPRAGLNYLWRHFWDLDRPSGPTADDAVAVLAEAGIRPEVERSPRPSWWASPSDERVASARRYLCLPAERDPEIAALMADPPEPARPAEVVTLSWEGRATT